MPRPTELMVYMFENIREEEHASFKGPEKKWTGSCKFCNHSCSDVLGTTSNFVWHSRNHPKEVENFQALKPKIQGKQQSLSEAFQKAPQYGQNDPKQKTITDSFVKNVVIKCGAPINLVSKEGFQDFMKVVDPKRMPCGRNWISSKKLPQLFSQVKLKRTTKLASVQFMSATLDIWTDPSMKLFWVNSCQRKKK